MNLIIVITIAIIILCAMISAATNEVASPKSSIRARVLQNNALRISPASSSCLTPLEVLSKGGSHAIDGSSLDWRTSPIGETQSLDESNAYFLANLFDGDDRTSDVVLARAYGNFDCLRKRLFIAVLIEGTNFTEIGTSLIRGVTLFDANSVPIGWEVSYSFAPYPDDFCLPGFVFQAVAIPGKKTATTGSLALKYKCSTENLAPSPVVDKIPTASPSKTTLSPVFVDATSLTPSNGSEKLPSISPLNPTPAPVAPSPVMEKIPTASPSKPTRSPVFVDATPLTPSNGSEKLPSISPLNPTPAPVLDDTTGPTRPDASESICDGYCRGTYPYGCAENLDFPWKYMCEPGGGCYYSYDEDDDGPYDDNSIFCTYKTQTPSNPREQQGGGLRTKTPINSETSKNDCDCDGYCMGSFPYGCATNLDGIVKYMCLPDGGCYYTDDEFDDGPYNDNSVFCTYRDLTDGGNGIE